MMALGLEKPFSLGPQGSFVNGCFSTEINPLIIILFKENGLVYVFPPAWEKSTFSCYQSFS